MSKVHSCEFGPLFVQYSKCSTILNNFILLFSSEMLDIGAGIHKMLVRIMNREDPDQSASSCAVCFDSFGRLEVFKILECLP